jgi:hypothetical protein
MTIKFWRLIALLAVSGCFALTAAVVWVALAYGSNLREIKAGAQVCLAGSRSYDSVAAAQMIGRLDLVSFLLTAGGLMLAVFALMGFWMIRREALDEAGRVARDEARKIAQEYALDENQEGTYLSSRRAGPRMRKPARVKTENRQTPNFDPATVSTAGAVKEGPTSND